MKSKLDYKKIIGKVYIIYGLVLIVSTILALIIGISLQPELKITDLIILISAIILQIIFIYYLLTKGKKLRKIKKEKQNELMKALIYAISLFNLINFIFGITLTIYNYKMSKAK